MLILVKHKLIQISEMENHFRNFECISKTYDSIFDRIQSYAWSYQRENIDSEPSSAYGKNWKVERVNIQSAIELLKKQVKFFIITRKKSFSTRRCLLFANITHIRTYLRIRCNNEKFPSVQTTRHSPRSKMSDIYGKLYRCNTFSLTGKSTL